MSKRFYQITKQGRTADINIYGDISSHAEIVNKWYDADLQVSARSIVSEINDLDVDTINVYINSYGGEVAEALAIYSALKRHSASVHTYVDGFACSAATIIFCAGDARTMGAIALMMIHNCMSYIGYANSEEMRKAAEDNDKINQSSIEAYKLVSNLSEDRIREMMNDQTWLTASECLEYGFATEIADQEDDTTAQQSAFGLIRKAVLNAAHGTAEPVVDIREDFERITQQLDSISERLDAFAPAQKEEPPIVDNNGKPDSAIAENKAIRFINKLLA